MKLISNAGKAKTAIMNSGRLVNLSAIRKSGVVGYDLPFLFEIHHLLEKIGVEGDITIHCFRYPYTSVAELLYFHLGGSTIETQQKTLQVLGLNTDSASLHSGKNFDQLTSIAGSFEISLNQFKALAEITLKQLPEISGYKNMVLDDCLDKINSGSSNLEYCITLLGENFMNRFYSKNISSKKLCLHTEYTKSLDELEKIVPEHYVSNSALQQQIEKSFTTLQNFSHRMADRCTSLYSLLDTSASTGYPLRFIQEERIRGHFEKECGRYKEVAKFFCNNVNLEKIVFEIYNNTPHDYKNVSKALSLALIPQPLQTLKLIRKLRKHPAVLQSKGDIAYISGGQIVNEIIKYCSRQQIPLINQNFEERTKSLDSLFLEYDQNLPLIQAPPNNTYPSHNNNFVFGTLDVYKN